MFGGRKIIQKIPFIFHYVNLNDYYKENVVKITIFATCNIDMCIVMKNSCKILFPVIFLLLLPARKIHAETLEGANANYPQITNLPTLYINTVNSVPVTSNTNYIPGTLVAVSSDSKEELLGAGSGVVMEIRGRGHSTWGGAKKPYRIKFDTKTNFLNLPAHAKSWVLMASHYDKSLIRNAVAMKISSLIGLEFTPAARFVDVVLNGVYIGNYMVSDQVEVREKRVEVEEQDAAITALPDLSGGYLLEIDGFADGEPVWFFTGKSLKVTVKYPKNDDDDNARINPQQLNYIIHFTQKFEDALFASNFKDPELGYRALVDTTSLVNWYIGCELSGNSDSFWSTYIYKRRNIDQFFFGPMWDYDIAFNNDNRLGDATEKLMRDHAHNPKTWIQRLWQDEWFRGAVYRRWMKLVDDEKIIDQLTAYIDETATLIDASQRKNYETWGNLGNRIYLEQALFSTYNEYITYLKKYLGRRANFLTRSFTSDNPPEPTKPFVADDFYYMIMNVRSNNVIQVRNQSNDVNAMLELWAPQPDNDNQEWNVLPATANKFQIINRKSGMAITGNGRGNNLVQSTPDVNNTAQLWAITPVNTGDMYGIENAKSGYSINNSGGSTVNGTAAIEWDNNIAGSQNQQWYFQKTDPIPVSDVKYNELNTIDIAVLDGSLIVNGLEGKNRVSIYAVTGQLVYSAIIDDSQFSYPLKSGCYILSVTGKSLFRTIIAVI